tara:strand:- start:3215 stop:3409 length:195 start_codon:yes stop_codon:yes gene_type:complete
MKDPTYNPKKKKHRCYKCGVRTPGPYGEFIVEDGEPMDFSKAEPTGRYWCSLTCAGAIAPPEIT